MLSLLKKLRLIFLKSNSKHKIKYFSMLALLIISSLIDLIGLGALLPVFMSIVNGDYLLKIEFLNSIVEKHNLIESDLIIIVSFASIIIFFIKNLIYLLIIKKVSKYSNSFLPLTSFKLFKYYFNYDFNEFFQNESNILYRNIRHGSERFSTIFIFGSLIILSEFVLIFLILISILLYEYRIILLSSLVFLFYFIFYRKNNSKVKYIGYLKNSLDPKISETTYQSIFGFTEIKMHNKIDYFSKKIGYVFSKLSPINNSLDLHKNIPTKLLETLILSFICIIIISGTMINIQKNYIIELLGVMMILAYKIAPSINKISLMFNSFSQEKWVVSEVFNSLNIDIHIDKNLIGFNNSISFKNVNFSYENDTVLNNLSFEIKKNSMVAITGKSGKGKSSILRLLLKIIEPTSGIYYLDDKNSKFINCSELRKIFGYVKQEPFIISGTIKDNICFGLESDMIDENRLKKVINLTSLEDYINKLEDGFNYYVGEYGKNLSGGQRQRIAIARTLYHEKSILLLDEITSSLDKKTTRLIMEMLVELKNKGVTIIMVTHDINNLDYFDKVIEL